MVFVTRTPSRLHLRLTGWILNPKECHRPAVLQSCSHCEPRGERQPPHTMHTYHTRPWALSSWSTLLCAVSSRRSRMPQKLNQLLSLNCSGPSCDSVASPVSCASYHHKQPSHFSKHGPTTCSRASWVLKYSDTTVKAKQCEPVNKTLGSSLAVTSVTAYRLHFCGHHHF